MSDQITPSQFPRGRGPRGLAPDQRRPRPRSSAPGRSPRALRFVQAISELQGVEDHRPCVDVRHDGVTVHMITVYTDNLFRAQPA